MRHGGLILALVACGKPEKVWIDTHATQLHVGTLETNIPDGWRDFNELVNKPSVRPPEGSRMILLETDPNGGRIIVVPLPGAIQGDLCVDAAKLWQEQLGDKVTLSDAESANFNGSKGCKVDMSSPSGSGELVIVTPPGGSTAEIVCFGRGSRLDGAGACDQVVYGLHATPTK